MTPARRHAESPKPAVGVPQETGLAQIPPLARKPASGIRPLGPVDIAPLEAILARVTENLWRVESDTRPNNFACFHHTRHIVFRFCDFQDIRVFDSYPAWKIWSRSLLPVMDRASAPYGFAQPTYPKAMFASLAAGYGIDVHTDGGAATRRAHKIHVPIRTEPAAVAIVDGVEQHLRRGHAYEINNTLPHGAFNGGSRDRVHFIFEVFDRRPMQGDEGRPLGTRAH